jgi:hypothetical protein
MGRQFTKARPDDKQQVDFPEALRKTWRYCKAAASDIVFQPVVKKVLASAA